MGLKLPKNDGFTSVRPGDFKKSLIGALGDCVDHARDIHTQLGLRPYTVRIVRTRWSGGVRGEGVEEVVEETPILPTPKLDLGSIDQQMLSVGREEFGSLQVEEISTRYTEDQLLGRPGGESAPLDEQFYYEVEYLSDTAGVVTKRRFQIDGTPSLNTGGVQWSVRLIRAGDDRQPDGTPEF